MSPNSVDLQLLLYSLLEINCIVLTWVTLELSCAVRARQLIYLSIIRPRELMNKSVSKVKADILFTDVS